MRMNTENDNILNEENPESVDGVKVLVKDDIYTLSNLISVSRIFVAFPVIYLHYHNDMQINTVITTLIVYGVLSDYLDGLMARWRNEVSEFGKVMDPVADKLMAFFLFIYAVWLGWIPLWFFLTAVVRDLLIMAGSFFIKKYRGKVAMSVMSGKVFVNALALYWIVVFFIRDATGLHNFLLYICVVLMVMSFIDYYYRFVRIMKGAEFN